MKKINLITKKDEALHKRIEDNCLRAHLVPPIKTTIMLLVESADGTPKLEIKMPSKSYLRNFYNLLAAQAMAIGGTGSYEAGSLVVKGMTGTSWSQAGPHYLGSASGWGGTAGTTLAGIVVGSGTTAESFEHTALATQIAHGAGAGQLSYAGQSAASWSYNASTKKITALYQRVFQNISGGDVTVTELGFGGSISTANFLLMNRDLLVSPIVIEDGERLTVGYSAEFSYPA